MKITFGDDWTATVTDEPLRLTPRFEFAGPGVGLVPYGSREERERFLAGTFGSEGWLWDTPDVVGFDKESRELVCLELQLPYETVTAEEFAALLPLPPVVPGGLRADERRDCRLEITSVLHRLPGDRELVCLRDEDVLERPLDSRLGVAPDLSLLVQDGTVVGWSIADPVTHLTKPYADPDPAPPAAATHALLAACLDVVTVPLLHAVQDREPAAVRRLRQLHAELRSARADRSRTDALLPLVSNLVEDYADER